MARTRSPVRAVLIGSMGGAYGDEVRAAIARHRLEGRVECLGMVDEERKLDLYAHALAVYNGVYDEDYGYLTLEAFFAGKPVLTHDRFRRTARVRVRRRQRIRDAAGSRRDRRPAGPVARPACDGAGNGAARAADIGRAAHRLGSRAGQVARMKLAYFSPVPPARTGIAAYSSGLVPALAQLLEITVFTPAPALWTPAGVAVVDFVADPGALKALPAFDRVLYHLGNNPWFHRDILRAFLLWPDAVVLHDTVLYYLSAGGGRGALLEDLLRTDPRNAFSELDAILEASPEGDLLRYRTPARHPGLLRVLDRARQVLVHNRSARETVHESGFAGATDVIPLLHSAGAHPPPSAAETAAIRSELGYTDDSIVFGAFGFIGPTKRLDKVLEAFGRLAAQGAAQKARLLIVGDGDPIAPLVRRHRLEPLVTTLGFVDDDRFRQLVASVDVVLNLRYPSHGESSASLIQAMSYGRPCVVTDHGSFSELADDAVVKVSHGADEIDDLERAMRMLVDDRAARGRLGEAARRYVQHHHAAESVAHDYYVALAAARRCASSRRRSGRARPPLLSAMSATTGAAGCRRSFRGTSRRPGRSRNRRGNGTRDTNRRKALRAYLR